MARIVCNAREPAHLTGPKRLRTYQPGEVVQVFEDGTELGRKVEPATAPEDCPYVVLEVPGPRSDYLYLQDRHTSDPYIQTDPSLPEFGEDLEDHIAKRRHGLVLNDLPTQAQAEWAQTRGQGAGKLRRSLNIGKGAFEAAVWDKKVGAKINPNTVPRGRKR